MEDDWDLHAVVRGCSATTSNITTTTSTTGSCNQLFTDLSQDFTFGDGGSLFEPRRSNFIEESLQGLYKPFFTNPQTLFSPQSLPVSSLPVDGGFKDLSTQQQQHQHQQPPQQTKVMGQSQQSFSLANVSKTKPSSSTSHNPSQRTKRRKKQVKRVCHVPVEKLSSDMWSWRKYGQKPIKGSPYPRGYYRCSTLKGCMARKQVERNRSDPGMFIVTYTAEHNHPMPTHRNSLAGSTRQKTATPNSDDLNKPVLSPVMSPEETLSPAAEKLESSREDREEDLAEAEEEEEEDDFSVSSVVLDDDFFAGLEDFVGSTIGDCLSDHFTASIQFPWLANNATTTAAGGG